METFSKILLICHDSIAIYNAIELYDGQFNDSEKRIFFSIQIFWAKTRNNETSWLLFKIIQKRWALLDD